MAPAQPPLPRAWNFPFHPRAGSQTSILMSESDEGVSVAATRQKAGKRLNCCTAAGPIPGSVNPPAGTIWAKVIEVFGSTRADKLSHDAAALRACPYMIIVARRTAHDPPVTIFMALSSEVLTRGQRLLNLLAQEFLFSRRLTLRISCERRSRAHRPLVSFIRLFGGVGSKAWRHISVWCRHPASALPAPVRLIPQDSQHTRAPSRDPTAPCSSTFATDALRVQHLDWTRSGEVLRSSHRGHDALLKQLTH